MSKLENFSKEIRTNIGFQLVTNSEEFHAIWASQKLKIKLYERLILSYEIQKYCSDEVIRKILISDNEYLAIILSESLKKTTAYLKKKQYKFDISVNLAKDQYVRDWEGITIFIEADYRNFAEKMKIWREIEGLITQIINSFRKLSSKNIEKIDEANEVLATTIEKLNK